LGNSGGVDTEMVGQLVDGMLSVEERPDDSEPGAVGQKLEHLHG
jgi:hypothetical protein